MQKGNKIDRSPVFRLRICILVFVFSNILASTLFSQIVHLPIKNDVKELYFNEIKFPNGAPLREIFDFVEDEKGYIWIASQHGLLRFDGHNFKVFSHQLQHQSTIVDTYVISLKLFNDSILYIGCVEGMTILNLNTYQTKNFSNDTGTCPSKNIGCFYCENDTVVWVGGASGLFRFNPKTEAFSKANMQLAECQDIRSSSPHGVYSIEPHPFDKNLLLLGSECGLASFDKQKNKIAKTYPNPQLLAKNNISYAPIYKIITDGNYLWTKSWLSGINRFDLLAEKWDNYLFPIYYSHIPFAVSSLILKNKNELWVADRDDKVNYGFGIFNKETKKINFVRGFQNLSSTPLPGVALNMFLQKDSTIWLMYMYGRGVFRQNKNIKRFKNIEMPMSRLWVNSYLYVKAENSYYFGGLVDAEGIGRWDATNQKWKILKPTKKLSEAVSHPKFDFSVFKLFRDSKGTIWVGTSGQNLWYIDTAQFVIKPFLLADGKPLALTEGTVFEIFEDRNKKLWIGTRKDGVICIDENRATASYYKHNDKDSSSLINGVGFRTITEDKWGRLWIGNRNGFCIFDQATKKFSTNVFNRLRTKGIRAGQVYSIGKDTLNRMWMTMPGQGLIRISEEPKGEFDFKIFQTENGLKDLTISYMTTDKNGCFWIVNNGLLYFNPYNESYMLTDESNGLTDNIGGDDRIYIDDAGNVFSGDQIGVNWVNEVKEQSVNNVKNFFVEQVSVNGEPIKLFSDNNKPIILRNSQNNLTFDYTAVCFDESDQLRYRYKLESIEKEWNAPTTLLQARYMQLSPGAYRFVVDVAYKGRWLNRNCFVDFEIKQVFWKKWWFIALSCLLVTAIIISIFRYRLNQYIKLQNIRTKIASDLHDEVGSTLSSIYIMSDLLQSQLGDKPNAEEIIKMIGNNAYDMLETMDDIIWSVNPSNDEFQNLALRVREYAIPLLETKGIDFEIITPPELSNVGLAMNIRRSIFLIVKEAVNNLMKYSDCTRAQISFALSHSILKIEIIDNGKGFDINQSSNRNGLKNMKLRAEQIKGKLVIWSEINAGTRVTLSVKIG